MKKTLKMIGLFSVLLALPFMVFAGDYSENFNDATDVANWSHHNETNQWSGEAHDATVGADSLGSFKLTDAGYGMLAKRAITATIGTPYKLTLNVKTDGNWSNQATYPIYVEVEGIDDNDHKVYINNDTTFTTITLCGIATSDSGYIRLRGDNALIASTVWVDDVVWDDNTDSWGTIAEARAGADGDTVTTVGIVTATEMGAPFFIQDSAGIAVYDHDAYDKVEVGNKVLLTGVLATYNGLRQISNVDTLTVLSGKVTLPTPKEITANELDGEKYEGELVKLHNVGHVSGPWPANGESLNLTLNDGNSDFAIRIDSDTDVDGSKEPKWPLISITGIVGDYNGAQVFPRSMGDIEELNIKINEFLASNDATIADTSGEFEDYIEIVNLGSGATDIGGMFITDDLLDPTAWQIPTTDPTATTIPAGGYLKLWADKDTLEGVLHVNFKLSGGGEQIGLYRSDTSVIDTLTYGEQGTDIAYGRYPDGNDNWEFMPPTPEADNVQWPADLMFSEYIEGSGQNKALEIFNPRTDTVNLSDYKVMGSHNGDNDWNYTTFDFPDVELVPGDVYVISTTDADSMMKLVADTLLAYNDSSVPYFNGDDARALFFDVVMLDVIGKPEEDPGSGWDVAGVTEATKEHTLVRKASVTSGNKDWDASSASEWEVMPQNTFIYLGSHPHSDFEVPVIAGSVAEPTQIQIRYSEEVDSVKALDVNNYTVDGSVPTSVTKLNDVIYVLEAGTNTPNTDVEVIAMNMVDQLGLFNDADTIVSQYLTMDTTVVADKYFCEFETDLGPASWWTPTGSGSTYGIDGASSFTISSDFAYRGTQSAKLDVLDDVGASGGWFIREYNATKDNVASDSKIYMMVKCDVPDVQIRFVVDDDGAHGDSGYETSRWFDITATSDDWQVISLDLANDPVYGWVNGNGKIESTDEVSISSIQLQCAKDVDATIYMDILTERPAGTNAVVSNALPEKFALHQNYPNPFNPTTNINFDLPKAMDVKLVIYDIAGRKVNTLINSHVNAGYHNVIWNGTNDFGNRIASGIYIYRIQAGKNVETMKMSYIK